MEDQHQIERPARVPFRLPDMGQKRRAAHKLTRNTALTAGVGAVTAAIVTLSMSLGGLRVGGEGRSAWALVLAAVTGLIPAGLFVCFASPRWGRFMEGMSRARNTVTVRYLVWAHVLGLLMALCSGALVAAATFAGSRNNQVFARIQGDPVLFLAASCIPLSFLLGASLAIRTRWWGVRRAKGQRFARRRFGKRWTRRLGLGRG